MVRELSSGRNALCWGVVCAIVLSLPISVSAQILYGSIVGNVTDGSGAAIPGAKVSISNTATNTVRETLTSNTGGFTAPTLQAGVYTVKVSAQGFRPAEVQNVDVSINSVTRANVQLELGQVTETITVTDAAATLQTDRAEVRAEVTSKQLVNLPVPPGRNYQQLFKTIPGFLPPTDAHSIPSNPSRALRFNVNGTSGSSNNTRIDGASSTNVWLPHMTAYVPALESIENVNVVTNSFDAEQGLAGGAAVNVQIKSGTNEFHGSAFEYHDNNKTKAKPFFLPQGQRNPKRVYNQFGGTIGGPVVKNKIFFFASYEGTRDRRFASNTYSVPTEAMKTGDMSASTRTVYDPNTAVVNPLDGTISKTPFAGNRIPVSRLDTASAKILPLWPTANLPGSNGNYFAAAPFSFDRDTLDTKANFNLTDKFTSFVRYSILNYNTFNAPALGDALGGDPIAGGNVGTGYGKTHSLTVAGTYTLSSTFIVDAYFGYTKMNTNVEQPRLDENIGTDILGIPGTNGSRPTEGGWPQIQIGGYSSIGITNAFMPYFRHDPQFQYVTNFNWTKGAHNIRFGFDFYDQRLDHAQAEFVSGTLFAPSGGFNFQQNGTSQSGASANEYNGFSSFYLGRVNSYGKNILVPDSFQIKTFMSSLYFKDQWQVNNKLSLSMGLRWEYFPMPGRPGRGGVEHYDADTNQMLLCGAGDIPKDCGTKMSKKLFAPRLGLAYRLTDKTVIRAGYGITYDPYNLARPLRVNYPILIPYAVVSANSFLPESQFQDGFALPETPDQNSARVDMPLNVNAVFSPEGDFKRGYIQSWNFTVQHNLGDGFTAEAGYVATRSIRQLGYIDINAGQVLGANRDGQPLYARFDRIGSASMVTPTGTQRYDALQLRLNRRFSNGFQMGLGHTWAKTMGIAGNDNSDGTPAVQALAYYDRNHGRAGIDQRHNFQLTSIYELPFGRGKRFVESGVGAAILGGWQLNGVFSAYTGTPFRVSTPNRLNMPGSNNTANQISESVTKVGEVGPGQVFYDKSAFQQVTEQNVFGNMSYNSLSGPGAVNLDLGLFRAFQVTERFGMQFRAEAFNATNTPHFSNPNGDVSSSNFMRITGLRNTGREGIDERVFRLGLRLNF